MRGGREGWSAPAQTAPTLPTHQPPRPYLAVELVAQLPEALLGCEHATELVLDGERSLHRPGRGGGKCGQVWKIVGRGQWGQFKIGIISRRQKDFPQGEVTHASHPHFNQISLHSPGHTLLGGAPCVHVLQALSGEEERCGNKCETWASHTFGGSPRVHGPCPRHPPVHTSATSPSLTCSATLLLSLLRPDQTWRSPREPLSFRRPSTPARPEGEGGRGGQSSGRRGGEVSTHSEIPCQTLPPHPSSPLSPHKYFPICDCAATHPWPPQSSPPHTPFPT